jgi:cyclopropane-fatty-acyl-phospholipid synthase
MNLSSLAEYFQGVRFSIHQPDGQVLRLGQDGPPVDWHIYSGRTLRAILQRPQYELGRTYVRGEWDIDTPYLPALIRALIPEVIPRSPHRYEAWRRLHALLPAWRRDAPQPHWQDTSLWLSRICLGDELFHGCSHYREPGLSMEQAQRIRCRALAAHLQLEPGQRVLDLSAGWGPLPLYLAQHTGARVTALAATREQLQYAHGEARRRGLDAAVHFRLGDFRQCQGRFDRIIGSGLNRHYPASGMRAMFERLATLLQEDGMLWLQIIGRRDDSLSNRWYRRQLPQHAGVPLLSEVHGALEHTRLRTLLMEDLSAYRLQDLQTRMQRYGHRRAAISRRFGEPLARYWEFLLASEITAVQRGELLQYELVLGNARCSWPAPGAQASPDHRLPVDIARRISGLAGDI